MKAAAVYAFRNMELTVTRDLVNRVCEEAALTETLYSKSYLVNPHQLRMSANVSIATSTRAQLPCGIATVGDFAMSSDKAYRIIKFFALEACVLVWGCQFQSVDGRSVVERTSNYDWVEATTVVNLPVWAPLGDNTYRLLLPSHP